MECTNNRPESSNRSLPIGSIIRNARKSSTDGLIALSPDPGSVKFEDKFAPRPNSGSGCSENRSASAGHTERKLLMARKTEVEDNETRTNSAVQKISGHQISDKMQKLKIDSNGHQSTAEKTIISGAADRSDDDNEACSSTSDTKECGSEPLFNSKEQKVVAPLELKAEFLQAVMSKKYSKAQELCQKILLLEPDNATCREFHAVIVEKKKQDEENGGDSSDDSSDESSDDDENSDEGESTEDEEESESDSDNDDAPQGPLNLIMGGLPIRHT